MGTASDLLLASEDVLFTIDSSLRTIGIPPNVKNLGVESDDNVTRVYFTMPKTYGDIDLSTFVIRINYLNANADPDLYPVTDATIDGDRIIFSWLIGRNAAAYKGNVTFNVCLKDIADDGTVTREFNTTTTSLPILAGLETSEAVVQNASDYIVLLEHLLSDQIDDVVKYTEQTLTDAQKTQARTNIDACSKGEVTAGYMTFKTVAATLPASASWQSVTYGDGKFVAVVYCSTKAAYSTDGINWTGTTLPSASWQSVTYGDGKFVAVAYNGDKAAYSTDGINWTGTTLPDSAYWASVAYGDGKFVAVENNGYKAAYSTDGINWTGTTLPLASWGSVTYGDGKFVAVRANKSDKAAYSTDGINWTQITLPDSAYWQSVTYGDGKFVAVAYNGTKAAYSTDGINWTQTTLPASAKWRSVAYGDGKFVAVVYDGDKAAYSTDGINWTQTTLPASASWQSVTYGDGKFVAVENNGYKAAYSTDGINWTTEFSAPMQNGEVITPAQFGAASLSDIPTDDHINSLIDARLGAIENGAY